ncbi:MAG: hypothetical protein HY426_03265 [Candidatus Levybacteria bacterium]|nr:hypothetical protein [Candidatus Levybacteria bacterium]
MRKYANLLKAELFLKNATFQAVSFHPKMKSLAAERVAPRIALGTTLVGEVRASAWIPGDASTVSEDGRVTGSKVDATALDVRTKPSEAGGEKIPRPRDKRLAFHEFCLNDARKVLPSFQPLYAQTVDFSLLSELFSLNITGSCECRI